jgi:GIY-YIG catalytic domain-containing protein
MSEKGTFPTKTSLKQEVAEYCKRYCIVPDFPTSNPWDVEAGYRENLQFPDAAAAGCYAIYAADGELLYIGKAWQIGSRLANYFMGIRSPSPGASRPEHIWTKPPKHIQTIRVRESFEASSLEEYLIRKLRPCDNNRIDRLPLP